MAVYVDDAFISQTGSKGQALRVSHLIADTPAELAAMAEKLGLSPRHSRGDHYDVCSSKRKEALANGAKAIGWRECAKMVLEKRNGSMSDMQR
jgi:hypothetical protein